MHLNGLRKKLLGYSWAGRILALATLYFLLGRIGLLTALPPGFATAIWPASGIALAALLMGGMELWPGVFFGSLVLNLTIFSFVPEHLLLHSLVSLGIAMGSTTQALLGASLVRELTGTRYPFASVQNVVKFIGIEMVICTISATIGATLISGGRLAPWTRFGEIWLTWWLGDYVGILVFAPLILIWADKRFRVKWTRRFVLDTCVLVVGLILTGEFVFGLPFRGAVPNYPMAYLILPLIVWSSFRLGPAIGTGAIFLSSLLAIWSSVSGDTGISFYQSLLSVQLFVGVSAVTCLTLGAVLLERKNSEDERAMMLEQEKKLRLELARSNEDLERFAHVASHDLQEPLRMISTHLGYLLEGDNEYLKPTERQSIRFAVEGASRMKTLIHDLLEFSRFRTRPMDFTQVSAQSVLQEVLANLKVSIEEASATITFDSLPTLYGNRFQISQLFQNLISNALKYRNGHCPVVHIACRKRSQDWLFSIRDNGLGIESKNQEKIFQAFQRLHSRAAYPGTGLGLSVCKKIVEFHGGRIWVESQIGCGSTFYVAIPFHPPQELVHARQ